MSAVAPTRRVPVLREIDAPWLTRVLRSAGFESARVAGFRCVPIETAFTAKTVRFELTYDGAQPNGADRKAPTSVIGKFPSDDVLARSFAVREGMYLREIDFYRRLCSRVTARLPRCYLADIDSSGFVLLLEDVREAVPGNQLSGCSVETAQEALAQIAGLHAPTWCDTSLRKARWMSNRSPSLDRERFVWALRSLMPEFLVRFGGSLEPAERELFVRLGQCPTFPIHQPTVETFSAVHFDYRLANLLIGTGQQAGEITLIDWQTVRVADPLTDVANFMGACLSPQVRRTAEEELVRSYHRTVCSAGVDGFSWTDCWESYRRAALHGFCMVVFASVATAQVELNASSLPALAKRHACHALDVGADEFLE